MRTPQLLSYLENIVTLESAIQQQTEAANLLQDKGNLLGHAGKIAEPRQREIKKIKFGAPLLVRFFRYIFGENSFLSVLLRILFIIACLGYLWLLISTWALASSNFFYSLTPIKIFPIIFFGLFAMLDIFRSIGIKVKNCKNKAIANGEYAEECALYQEACTCDKNRLKTESAILDELESGFNQIAKNVQLLNIQLEKLYGQNIIYPDFRGLIPASYLYKYIASGIANSLDGPTGAYAQYLNDERTDRIIHKLDEITNQLIQISRNQRSQISILSSINNTLHGMQSSLGIMNENLSELNQRVLILAERQVDANTYLSTISSRLGEISSSVNIAATNSHVIALNDYRKSIEEGVASYYLSYPI